MTPEGKVKAKLRKLLNSFDPCTYHHWPVLNGMGKPTLDVIGCIHGRFFAIEVKAGKKGMTERQKVTAEEMQRADAKVFLVNDETGLDILKGWLEHVHTRTVQKRAAKSARSGANTGTVPEA